MTPKQRRFIEVYTGNATKAAIAAGYSKKTAYSIGQELLTKPEIMERIQEREAQRLSECIASREERQEFWTSTMRNGGEKIADRLKASELLAKSNGDFLERVEANISQAGPPTIQVVFTDDPDDEEV
jgi:phage terminase small subunit